MRDYQIVSPSLEGVLNDAELTYEGLKRPVELLRVLDGPSSKGRPSALCAEADEERKAHQDGAEETAHKGKVLERYFHDLYGIFMKRLSYFVVESEATIEDTVKLQAMFQEMIKVKELMSK